MTEAKKMLIAQRHNGKQIFNIRPTSLDDSFAFTESDSFVAQLTERLRMLSDESRVNAMLEILAILNQFTRVDESQTQSQ